MNHTNTTKNFTPSEIHMRFDPEITISVADSRRAKTWQTIHTTWSRFAEKLTHSQPTPYTRADYETLSKDEQGDVKDVGGYVGGLLKNGIRKKGHMQERWLITLDIDNGPQNILQIIQQTWPSGTACVVYSTHSHTPQQPRLRLVAPLVEALTGEEYEPLARHLGSLIGINYLDDTTFEAERLMYWPAHPKDMRPVCWMNEGEPVDGMSVLLEAYGDWRDASEWPRSKRQETLPLHRSGRTGLAEDPTKKTGIVGAFCRAYDIHSAITEFLPRIYQRTGSSDRYTYLAGETSNGLVTYDQKWAYSHHATDPTQGQLCNAFDLVRIHQYGDTHTSHKQMSEFAATLPAVKAELDAETERQMFNDFMAITEQLEPKPATNTKSEADKSKAGEVDMAWVSKLSRAENGKIANKPANYKLIAEHHPALTGIAYNQLSGKIEHQGLPWRKQSGQWTDRDQAQAVFWFDQYGLANSKLIADAITAVADDRAFHPIRDYLEGLPAWDGKPRIEKLLPELLGADDTDYARQAMRKTMIAAVARVFEPGIKFDQVLVLSGPQGIGKSSLFSRLAGNYFSDSLSVADMRDKTAAEKLQGYWLIEISELAGMRKMDEETVKSFISRQKDSYRASYARFVEDRPRQCVIVATNNSDGFLRDTTGNRRFWPVTCKGDTVKHAWDLTKEEVDQLWAEAYFAYTTRETLILPIELANQALEAQTQALEASPLEEVILAYLEYPRPFNWREMSTYERRMHMEDYPHPDPTSGKPADHVCALEIWCEAIGKNKGNYTRRDANLIASTLKKHGWALLDRSDTACLKYVSPYGRQRVFYRPASASQGVDQ